MLRTRSGLLLLAPRRGISEVIGGKALSSRWYAPTWSVAGGVLLNTPTLGAELITNAADREFSSDTGWWTKSLATISGGVANCNGTGSGVYRSILSLNTWYTVEIDFAHTSGSGMGFYLGNSDQGFYYQPTTARLVRSGLSNTTAICGIYGGTSEVCTLDNATLKQITASSLFATVNARLANVNLIAPQITSKQDGTESGIVLRLDSPINPQNFVVARLASGANKVLISKCVGGVYTLLSNIAATYGTAKYFSAKINGSSISIYYGTTDFGTLIATVTVSDASIVNNTRHGLFSTYSCNQFAGTFSVVPYA